MATKFNDIPLMDLGFVVQSVRGVLDLPERKGEIYYDWGNGYEALVSAEDIYFGSREITLDCFFDYRLGHSFEDISLQLEEMRLIYPLETEYGTYQVKFHELDVIKNYNGGKTVQLKFIELNPDLSGVLPTSSGNSGVKIDGIDLFVAFGLLVEDVQLYEVPELKASKETHFKSNVISVYRKPQDLNVKVNGIYASKAEMSTKIKQLNTCLAEEGLRHFVYKGDGFQCFAPEGHHVNIHRSRVEINFKWKVMAYYNVDELVQMVADQVVINANPQSDLSVTDPTAPDFIKGKDTFVAEDSNKLGGQLPAAYAKEAEIKALRDLDLAADLETATNF